MTKKHSQSHHSSDISILVLSLASAKLTLERCISSKKKQFCSLARFKSIITYRLWQWGRSLTMTLDRIRMAFFGGEPKKSVNKKSKTEILVSPTLVHSKKGEGSNEKQFYLPTFATEEISLLRDIVKFVYESRFDVVLLQEVQEEQTFVHLLQMFKEIKLKYAHYGRLDFRGSCKHCFTSDVHHTGLAVFSRWSIASVTVQQFDPVLSSLQLSTFLPTMISNFFSGSFCNGSGNGVIPESKRLANGVQYVQIQVEMPAVRRTTTVHIFNSDLLHQSFILPGAGQSDTKELYQSQTTDLEVWERNVLRFCQAYELAKLVNTFTKTHQQEQLQKKSDNFFKEKANGNSELVIIGGHFGRLYGDIFGVDCKLTTKPAPIAHKRVRAPVTSSTIHRITVQDVLQTFIDGLQNAFERPEKVITAIGGGSALLNRSRSFRAGQLFHSLKSEQLFIKFLDSPPISSTVDSSLETKISASSALPSKALSSASNSLDVHCRINFVQSKLRFDSYANTVFPEGGDGTFYESSLITIDSPRAVNFKLAKGEAICIEPCSDRRLQNQLNKSTAASKIKGKSLKSGAGNTGSSKKLTRRRTSPSVRNTMGQIEVKLVTPSLDANNKSKSTDRKLLVIEAFKSTLECYQRHLRQALLFDCLPPYLCSLGLLFVAVFLAKLPIKACTVLAVAFIVILYFTFLRRFAACRAKMSKIEWLLGQLNLEQTHLNSRLLQKDFQSCFESSVWETYFREKRSALQMSSSMVGVGGTELDLKMTSVVELDTMATHSDINDLRLLSHNSTGTF